MIIYPAIDLKSGQCVRLYQGSFDQVTTYDLDPLVVAKNYETAGAEFLHVVDLDGAKSGAAQQSELVLNIVKTTKLKVQMGGGIRDKAYAEKLLASGIARIVIGSLAMKEPELIKSWLKEFGNDKIVLALDVRLNGNEPMLAAHGWQQATDLSLWTLLDEYQDAKHILCTDIDCDGTLQGPNFNLYQQCVARYPSLQFQASGGIGKLDDLKKLAQLQVSGAITGKALYENKFTLKEAIKAAA